MTTSQASDDPGPLLYEERRHNTPAIVYTCLGLVFLTLGVLCSFIPPAPPPAPPHASLIMGGVVAAGGALCLVIGLVRLIPNIGASWHLHAHGARVRQRGKERVLRYDEVEELTVKVVRVFFHGVCTGEVYEVTFKPDAPGANPVRIKQVRRPRTAAGTDLDTPGELAQACDKVAGRIADRMAARMDRGERVPWVRDLALFADGLELGTSDRLAWREIERATIEQGNLHVSARGEPRPIVSVPTDLPNFFPGYQLLSERMGSAR